MKNNLNTIVTIAGFVVLYLVLSPNESKGTNTIIRELETKTHDTIVYSNTIKERIASVDLSGIENKIDSLISLRLGARDTLTIIKLQDTIINKQVQLIDTLKTSIKDRDTVISIQNYAIQTKDSIITLERVKVKKKNKDIIRMTLVALGAGVIAILK